MKTKLYLFTLALLSLWGCEEKIGFLDTTYAAYDPSEFTVRNIPLFQEETGWTLDEFWELRSELPTETEDRYLDEWSKNWRHYEDNTDWITTNLQGISGTHPIFVTLHSVTSLDGGDAVLFKSLVRMRGDGTVEFPAGKLPVGTFILSMKVENEDHEAFVMDCFTVRVIGEPGSFPLIKEE